MPGLLKEINFVFTNKGINITAQFLKTDADMGYVIIDAECNNCDKILKELKAIPHTIRARMLYCINKHTLRTEFKRLGWQMKRSKSKPMIPPSITELLFTNENLSRIYNNFDFRKTATNVSIPAVA